MSKPFYPSVPCVTRQTFACRAAQDSDDWKASNTALVTLSENPVNYTPNILGCGNLGNVEIRARVAQHLETNTYLLSGSYVRFMPHSIFVDPQYPTRSKTSERRRRRSHYAGSDEVISISPLILIFLKRRHSHPLAQGDCFSVGVEAGVLMRKTQDLAE
jgi:hypothetical protein